MGISRLTSREAVIKAIEEYDRSGSEEFLHRYHFGNSKSYSLFYKDKLYPSKAIAGVAYGYQYPNQGQLKSGQFEGGKPVKSVLKKLGFEVTS